MLQGRLLQRVGLHLCARQPHRHQGKPAGRPAPYLVTRTSGPLAKTDFLGPRPLAPGLAKPRAYPSPAPRRFQLLLLTPSNTFTPSKQVLIDLESEAGTINNMRFESVLDALRGRPDDCDCAPADYANKCCTLFHSITATFTVNNGHVTVATNEHLPAHQAAARLTALHAIPVHSATGKRTPG